KIDHNFNEKNHLLFHFFYGQGNQTQPPGASLALATASSNLGDYFEVAPIRIENYSLVWNSAISPRLTNQVLFGISYFTQVFHDKNNTFNEKALGKIADAEEHLVCQSRANGRVPDERIVLN